MVDVVDRITRSRMMSGIRGKDTQPELMLRRALHRLGLRYRLHVGGMPGRPDIVLPKYRAVIQVHGCFWHRHERCASTTTPASNAKFWKSKFEQTIMRDQRNVEKLLQAGWRTAVVWECTVESDNLNKIANRLAAWLLTRKTFLEIPQGGPGQITTRKRRDRRLKVRRSG